MRKLMQKPMHKAAPVEVVVVVVVMIMIMVMKVTEVGMVGKVAKVCSVCFVDFHLKSHCDSENLIFNSYKLRVMKSILSLFYLFYSITIFF